MQQRFFEHDKNIKKDLILESYILNFSHYINYKKNYYHENICFPKFYYLIIKIL